MNLRNILYYLSLVIIAAVSFFLYSSRFYPLLNSDDALNILMTYYYKLPQDLYCWGQDRGGTLIPLISQIFHKGMGLPAVNAVSLSNYLVLILGYIGFSSLFKNRTTKLLFAILWFFPPLSFIDLTRFPLGVQYSLTGLALFVCNRIDFIHRKKVANHLLILLFILLLAASLWVSDLAVVSIISLLAVMLLFHFLKEKKFTFNVTIPAYFIAGATGIFLFIRYAKSNATVITENYTSFNDLCTIQQGLQILWSELFEIFTFRNEEIFLSVYAWLALLCVLFIVIAVIKKSLFLSLNTKKWLAFFIIDFSAVFATILLSRWVYLNGMGRWYFIPSYISLSMVILLLFDSINTDYFKRNIITPALFIAASAGALSTVHYLKYVSPGTLRSQIDVRSEFLSLGEIGIIGEYWNSYISAAPDPSKIKATPHDGGEARNQELVNEVFAQPGLYVIKDLWMTSFPDTLYQYGYILVRKDSSFRMGDCDVNRYVKIKPDEIAPL